MTGNQARTGTGSRHPEDFMILTPAHIAVPAGEEFSASVTVWPAGPRHQVSATPSPGADLRIEVRGHKVTVTGRLAHARDRHTVLITLRDDTDTAHDTLTIEATVPRHVPSVQ
ncbi:hypothetical protein [Streptomyces sp. RP5T]|uniref:hypothetical protein n=1 Tax=Streptomyces sp. RP5T TaxID=2490848 RepID=UPI000F655C0C|nr:hypothetical protein [Streptomyces sp. RP5T]RRR87665.1 hypothetical protein EHS43_00100 [Streptomyces sp. RP5T]